MNFENPEKTGITIYTKTNCINCDKIKGYLHDNQIKCKLIHCDEYIKDEESKKHFLDFLISLTGKKIRQFPIIFVDWNYIGSYYEFLEYYGDF